MQVFSAVIQLEDGQRKRFSLLAECYLDAKQQFQERFGASSIRLGPNPLPVSDHIPPVKRTGVFHSRLMPMAGNAMLASYWHALDHSVQFDPHFIISAMDLGSVYRIPTGPSLIQHIRLEFHDVMSRPQEGDPQIAPLVAGIQRIIEFARSWDGRKRLLVHCMAGVSRSAAIVLVVLAVWNPGHERKIATLLRQHGPWVSPNPLVIEIADELLGLKGKLIAAVDQMGPALMRGVPEPILLPGSFGG